MFHWESIFLSHGDRNVGFFSDFSPRIESQHRFSEIRATTPILFLLFLRAILFYFNLFHLQNYSFSEKKFPFAKFLQKNFLFLWKVRIFKSCFTALKKGRASSNFIYIFIILAKQGNVKEGETENESTDASAADDNLSDSLDKGELLFSKLFVKFLLYLL